MWPTIMSYKSSSASTETMWLIQPITDCCSVLVPYKQPTTWLNLKLEVYHHITSVATTFLLLWWWWRGVILMQNSKLNRTVVQQTFLTEIYFYSQNVFSCAMLCESSLGDLNFVQPFVRPTVTKQKNYLLIFWYNSKEQCLFWHRYWLVGISSSKLRPRSLSNSNSVPSRMPILTRFLPTHRSKD